jgi:hypothetical protein
MEMANWAVPFWGLQGHVYIFQHDSVFANYVLAIPTIRLIRIVFVDLLEYHSHRSVALTSWPKRRDLCEF